ncbi:MAG: N-6 DNA methylase, partial [bacterium]|nr:N-6 DNA methylase [bacterium]
DLDRAEESDQVKRYLGVFSNFILTNFLEFRLYRFGSRVSAVSLADGEMLSAPVMKPAVGKTGECRGFFRDFFSFNHLPGTHNLDNGYMEWLAKELAGRTRLMRDEVVIPELEKEMEPGREADRETDEVNHIHGLYQAFKTYLIHHLTPDLFADLYSQTLTFGLFTAFASRRSACGQKEATKFIPSSSGILRDIFRFIDMGDIPKQLDYFLEDITMTIGSVNPMTITENRLDEKKDSDLVFHFYETFLKRYDPRLRGKKGVYYTPDPVVRFIVRSVDIILKKTLNKSHGLADRSINILDPASGTSTFLAAVARHVTGDYLLKYGRGAQPQMVKRFLLKNLYGFEEMMAPYAVGHLRMLFLLKRLGVPPDEGQRFNLYLTNTLEMENIEQSDLPGMASLSRESRLAGKVKKEIPVTVVLGNPPYAGHSSNKSGETWIGEQIESYKRMDGEPLGEKNLKWLHDDYVKFIRFAQYTIDRNPKGEGVVGFITNHGYLDNPTFRGMRRSLMESFDEIHILDLHGNLLKKEKCPDGSPDQNVFDIRQGVAIGLFVKKPAADENRGKCRVFHADLWGKRKEKYLQLDHSDISTVQWTEVFPVPGFYLFTPTRRMEAERYGSFFKVTDIFPVHSVGIVTARDRLTIKRSKEEMYRTVMGFASAGEAEARRTYGLGDDTRDWQVKQAQQDLLESRLDRENIVRILYRPFDTRYTYYTGRSRGFLCMPRPEVMRHMLWENVGLVTVRQVAEGIFNHCLVTDTIVESRVTTSNKGIAYLFPLYLYPYSYHHPVRNNRNLFTPMTPSSSSLPDRQSNIDPRLLRLLGETPGFSPGPRVEEVFYYIYAVLFSRVYRESYAEGLKIDFPRIPFTSDHDVFTRMGRLG